MTYEMMEDMRNKIEEQLKEAENEARADERKYWLGVVEEMLEGLEKAEQHYRRGGNEYKITMTEGGITELEELKTRITTTTEEAQ